MVFCPTCQVQYENLPDWEGVGEIVAKMQPKLEAVYSGDVLMCPGCHHRIVVTPDQPYAGKGNGNAYAAIVQAQPLIIYETPADALRARGSCKNVC